jgi:hypothetical protein
MRIFYRHLQKSDECTSEFFHPFHKLENISFDHVVQQNDQMIVSKLIKSMEKLGCMSTRLLQVTVKIRIFKEDIKDHKGTSKNNYTRHL